MRCYHCHWCCSSATKSQWCLGALGTSQAQNLFPTSTLSWDWNLTIFWNLNYSCKLATPGPTQKGSPGCPHTPPWDLHHYSAKARQTSSPSRGSQRQAGRQGLCPCHSQQEDELMSHCGTWTRTPRCRGSPHHDKVSCGAHPQLQPPSPVLPCSHVFKGHLNRVSWTQMLNYYLKLWVSYFLKHWPYAEAENGQSVVSFMKLFSSFLNQSGKPLMAWEFFSLSVKTLMILI